MAGRLAGTGIKLKGKLTLEFDKDIDPSQFASLLGQGVNQVGQSSSLDSRFPLFPQSYLSSHSGVNGGRGHKFNYRSPDVYPTAAGMVNKGESVTVY